MRALLPWPNHLQTPCLLLAPGEVRISTFDFGVCKHELHSALISRAHWTKCLFNASVDLNGMLWSSCFSFLLWHRSSSSSLLVSLRLSATLQCSLMFCPSLFLFLSIHSSYELSSNSMSPTTADLPGTPEFWSLISTSFSNLQRFFFLFSFFSLS